MLTDAQSRAAGLLVLLILETLACAVYSAIAICLAGRDGPVRDLVQPLLNSWRNTSLLFVGCYLFNEVWIRAAL